LETSPKASNIHLTACIQVGGGELFDNLVDGVVLQRILGPTRHPVQLLLLVALGGLQLDEILLQLLVQLLQLGHQLSLFLLKEQKWFNLQG
jgi:hypothetical protein